MAAEGFTRFASLNGRSHDARQGWKYATPTIANLALFAPRNCGRNAGAWLIAKSMRKNRARDELLASLHLGREEFSVRARQAMNPEYWRSLSPVIPVDSLNYNIREPAFSHDLVEESLRSLRDHGYFHAGPLISEPIVKRMRGCVEAVKNAGWPPVFAFAYDPFWAASRASFICEFLSALLGPGFDIIMSRVWCYYIRPVRGAGGWAPHADAYRDHRNRITLWIPLTDATLDNGCMYVIPRDFIEDDRTPAEERLRASSLPSEYCLRLLHSCRALPAVAGSILGWDPRTIHWGSKCHAPGEPRISIGCEFVSRGVTPKPHKIGELAPGDRGAPLPGFMQRIRNIALSIRIHHARDLKSARFADLAEELIKQTADIA